MPVPKDFDTEVYAIAAQIPRGKILTYGRIAQLVGMPSYARRVGHALSQAPAGIPCHRIVTSSGRTAPGWAQQRELLEAEGVPFKANGCVALRRALWELPEPE